MNKTEKEKIRRKERDNTPEGKMLKTINNWKYQGLKCESRDDYELIYDKWLNSSRCEECKCEYSKNNKKCMDHNHDTGLFRNILCNSCNANLNSSNTSGIPNISWREEKKSWRYIKQVKGKQHCKSSNDLEWLKNYKKEYELKHIYIH